MTQKFVFLTVGHVLLQKSGGSKTRRNVHYYSRDLFDVTPTKTYNAKKTKKRLL